MSRPRKRPRLHFMCSVSPSPDAEINTARKRNDLLLKTRWESIFERYERDFTGIGDEVGFATDDVIVDNGHLRSMQNDRDTGGCRPQEKEGTRYDGKRLLRAMTAAPSECASSTSGVEEIEEVLQSIETMTEDVFLDEYSSDDELFNPNTEMDVENQDDLSEVDSLFDARPNRSPSVDSLFDATPRDTIYEAGRIFPANHGRFNDLALPYSTATHEDVLHRHRSLIREEVRNILSEHKEKEEAKLEPAWRIPVRLSSAPCIPRGSSLPGTISTNRQPPRLQIPESDEGGYGDGKEWVENEELVTSIWHPARRIRRPRKVVTAERNLKRIRAESEDPLQEGFSSDAEPPLRSLSMARSPARSQTGPSSKSAHLSSSPEDTDEEGADETGMEEEDAQEEDLWETGAEEQAMGEAAKANRRHTRVFGDDRELPAALDPTIVLKLATNTIDDSNIDRAEKARVVGRATQEYLCDYCQHQYTTSGSVGHHWDRTLNNYFQGLLSSDDPHSVPILWSIRSVVGRRIRPKKLKAKDFRSLVELHEGNGLSFDQIAEAKALWTTKPGNELSEEYAKFRRFAEDGVPSTHQYPFTNKDKACILRAFLKNPEITMHGLVRIAGRLIKRSDAPRLTALDLGHCLADVFLLEFWQSHSKGEVVEQAGQPTLSEDSCDQVYRATSLPEPETQHVQSAAELQDSGYGQDIKVESDDELFHPR
ncbi:hypothetical protein H2198_002356 [Neophaeococcomyces mojaviensis]|uniref:Uncharacterized protein n=1 Tax=Neophaeococcomyces mojaviensis TaxID=3383035 RepID=A0ACC3AF00_9EURO|nr:hypothetical protein H2198_002356 [Knufia sp. JES_112]